MEAGISFNNTIKLSINFLTPINSYLFMQYYTHLAFFGIIALPLLNILPIENTLIFLTAGCLFALFPDIDQSNSKVGKHIKPIGFFMKHRGIMHTIWIPLAFAALSFPFSPDIAFALFLGYTSHLVADAFTKEGVRFIYPIKVRAKGFIAVGSIGEKMLFTILLFIVLYMVN